MDPKQPFFAKNLGSCPPSKLSGWQHSRRVLVYYPACPELGKLEKFSIAYFHYEPPFDNPKWVDFYNGGTTPQFWWDLPEI
jgi:hypothetical protein